MTAEEIFKLNTGGDNGLWEKLTCTELLFFIKSMKQYAKQEALLAFKAGKCYGIQEMQFTMGRISDNEFTCPDEETFIKQTFGE